MSAIAKLNLQTVKRQVGVDKTAERRRKLLQSLQMQREMLRAELAGKKYQATKKVWVQDADGQQTLTEVPKRMRAWYFEQDGGWYVQCRYGMKIMNISGKNNSVFVNKKSEIGAVLDAFMQAVQDGELDREIEAVSGQRKLAIKLAR